MNFDFFGAGETKDQEIEKKGGEIQALTSTLETAKVYFFCIPEWIICVARKTMAIF